MRPVIASEEDEYQNWLLTEYVPISGGDENADPGDTAGLTPEGAEGENPGVPPGEGDNGTADPGEPKDDKGVPLKNRLEEERRKREKAERKLLEEQAANRARQEEWERQQAALRKTQEGAEPEEDLDSLQYSDPARYRALVAEEAARKAAEAVRTEMTAREKAKEAQTTFERLKDQYDELADPESEFYQEVDREYTAKLRRLGIPYDAQLLEDTVQLIAYRKQKKPVNRSTERPPVGEMGNPRGNPNRNPKITDGSRKLAKALGFSEKRLNAAFSRDLSNEIGTGTRG